MCRVEFWSTFTANYSASRPSNTGDGLRRSTSPKSMRDRSLAVDGALSRGDLLIDPAQRAAVADCGRVSGSLTPV